MTPLEPFPDEDPITCNDCGHDADDHNDEEPFLCRADRTGAGCDCEGLDLGGEDLDEDDEGDDV